MGDAASTSPKSQVDVAKVPNRPVGAAGWLSSGRGAHIGRSGRVGGCAGRVRGRCCEGGGPGCGVGRGEGCQAQAAGLVGWWAMNGPWLEAWLPWEPVVRPWSWGEGCRGPKWATFHLTAGHWGGGSSRSIDILMRMLEKVFKNTDWFHPKRNLSVLCYVARKRTSTGRG